MLNRKLPSRVFITGANGFIGRALQDRYTALGVPVAGMDIAADKNRQVSGGDLLQPDRWQSALEGSDLLIHCAALVSNTGPYQKAWDINVRGTRKVLECATKAGVARFVQISSVAAYGFDFTDGVNETAPLRPVGHPYIDSKIASEHVALAAHGAGEIDATIVRPGDVYGPASRPWVVLPLEMIRKGRMMLPAHGLGVFSPVYIDDIVEGIVLAASEPGARGHIFNIDGGQPVTCSEYFSYLSRFLGKSAGPKTVSTATSTVISELVGRMERLMGKPSELGKNTIGMLTRRGGYSIDKARTILGYEPAFSLEQGMKKVEEWLASEKMI